jgi:hypothetical protein
MQSRTTNHTPYMNVRVRRLALDDDNRVSDFTRRVPPSASPRLLFHSVLEAFVVTNRTRVAISESDPGVPVLEDQRQHEISPDPI